MMDACRPELEATDYTLQASAVVIANGVAATLSGFSAEAMGYAAHFATRGLLCAAGVLYVLFLPNSARPFLSTGSGER
jgi:MFS transporter, PAT family, beta-lactamase induction signal transducer AmpG